MNLGSARTSRSLAHDSTSTSDLYRTLKRRLPVIAKPDVRPALISPRHRAHRQGSRVPTVGGRLGGLEGEDWRPGAQRYLARTLSEDVRPYNALGDGDGDGKQSDETHQHPGQCSYGFRRQVSQRGPADSHYRRTE
jgi:hypothetical protein